MRPARLHSAATRRARPIDPGPVLRKGEDWPLRQEVEFAIDLPTPNVREHHYQRAARVRRQRHVVEAMLRSFCVRPRLPVIVTLVRLSPRPLDDDNLAYSAKAARDSVAAWLGCKDGPLDPVRWAYAQERLPRGALTRLRVTITEQEIDP